MPSYKLKPGVIEGQTIQQNIEVSVDVCIVGSGAGGSVAAHTLQAAGLKVLVVEEGGYFTSNRFRMRESEAYPNLYQESAQRATKDLSVSVFQGRAVGGGTVINWTTCFRTPEEVVASWNKYHGVKNLKSDDLQPHFDAIESRLNIKPIPIGAINRNNRALLNGCKALGYEASPIKRNVRGCAHTGYCGMGCPIDAKQSMLVTYLPDAMDKGATILSRCRINRIHFEGEKAVRLEGSLLDAFGIGTTGGEVVIKAKHFILAAGAIGTPAILMRSGAPDPHEVLGKRTFLHPVVAAVGIYKEPIEGYYGAPQSISSHHFSDRGKKVGFFLEAAPVHPLLVAINLPGYAKQHRKRMKQLPFMSAHLAIGIDGFHPEVPGGEVTLRNSGAPLLDYTPAPMVYEAFREATKTMARIQLAAGATQVLTTHNKPIVIKSEKDIKKLDKATFAPGALPSYSAHQMGGAGMSDSAKLGVVRSADLRHHQIKNLHVIDGSVFPTSLGVNPQESIYGLSRYIATKLAAKWT